MKKVWVAVVETWRAVVITLIGGDNESENCNLL